MKRQFIFSVAIFSLLFLSAAVASAQVRPPIPRASQKATVSQTIGSTDVTITYSRPAVKGRKVYGDWPTAVAGEATLDNQNTRPKDAPLVPWGHVWRSGANEATLFVVADDVLINGQPLAAGKYSLHSVPGQDDWTFIFNKDDGQWGSFSYDAAKDALRVKAKPQWTNDSVELLTYDIDNVTDKTAQVNLRWEKLRVPFTVEVKDVVAATIGHLRTFVAAASPDDASPAFSAYNYARTNKYADDAAKWLAVAVKASEKQVKKKADFANLRLRTNILIAAGKTKDAIAAGERAVVAGKAEKADVSALEKRIADIKAGKQ